MNLPTVICDTREQAPWTPWISHGGKRLLLPVLRRKLDAGDYSVEGHEHEIAIERKSLADWVQTMFGTTVRADKSKAPNWDRFKREIERVQANGLVRFCVIVESSRERVRNREYVSQVHPASVIGRSDSIWVDHGVQVVWAGERGEAERLASWMLHRWWEGRRRVAQGSAA